MHWISNHFRNGSARAFTIIELIGVLAIISLLAAAAAPGIIKRVDHSAGQAEKQSVKAVTDGMLATVLRNRQIPTDANLPAASSQFLNYSTSMVLTNARLFPRRFIVDPALSIAGGVLPYTQSSDGAAARPANARIIVLSAIAHSVPVVSGLSSAEFNTLWNAPEGSKPAPLNAWPGYAEDLVLQRVDFGPQFHKVVLVNMDPNFAGPYAVDGSSTVSVPVGNQRTGYFLTGTILSFFQNNGTLDAQEIVRGDISFVFQNNRWGRRLGPPDDVEGEFGNWVEQFLLPPAPTDPKFAATQQAVINEFYSYLWGYATWAMGDAPKVPSFSGLGMPTTVQYPYYSVVNSSQVNLKDFTNNLIQ